jgi:hypothetical protein
MLFTLFAEAVDLLEASLLVYLRISKGELMIVKKLRNLSAIVVAAIAMASSATAASAACATNVVGQWLVTLNSGMTYTTSIHAGGTLKSNCDGCASQTWKCEGNTFTVSGPGSTVVPHTIVSAGRMESPYGSVTRGGGGGVAKSSSSDCSAPPAPKAKRTNEWSMCLKVTNTNSNKKCRFGYTYKKGNIRLSGNTLGAGESETQCSLAKGVDIEFEKWTRSAGSAR